MTRAVSVLLFLKVFFIAVSVIDVFTEQKQFLHHCMKVENASALKINPFRHKVLPTKEARYANSIDYYTYLNLSKADALNPFIAIKHLRGLPKGSVLITEKNLTHFWFKLGLRPGDVITKVTTFYNTEIENISEFLNGRTVLSEFLKGKIPCDIPLNNIYYTWEKQEPEYIRGRRTSVSNK